MSIIISGIDMPTNCTRCPCSDDGARFCRAANEYIPMLGKPNFCPLVEVEERKTGKWIQDQKSKRYHCDQCLSFALKTDDMQENLSDFCPVCGADMREQP